MKKQGGLQLAETRNRVFQVYRAAYPCCEPGILTTRKQLLSRLLLLSGVASGIVSTAVQAFQTRQASYIPKLSVQELCKKLVMSQFLVVTAAFPIYFAIESGAE